MLKKLSRLSIVLMLLGIAAWAQEIKNELTVQGSGFFQKQTTHNGITNLPSNSGGVMAGYRLNLKKWLAVEGDYDYFRNHETFSSSSGGTFIPTNVHAATGTAIVKLPSFMLPRVNRVSAFVLGGGGAMFFAPRAGSLGEQTRGAFVYGAGVDVPVSRRFLVRAQYRGFVYKMPDFGMANLKTDKHTHAAVPSVGVVYRF